METKAIELNKLNLKKIDMQPIQAGDVTDNTSHAYIVVQELAALIDQKQDLINNLQEAIETEITATLDYEHRYNTKLLNTDFPEVLGEAKPNKDKKEAWIHEQLQTEYDAKQIAEENTKIIRKQIELLDNRISLEKYIIQLRQYGVK